MLTFKVLDTLKLSNDVLEMLTNTKPTIIKTNNGKIILIERTNIKSVSLLFNELTYEKKKIFLFEYPINEIMDKQFYIPTTKLTYSLKEITYYLKSVDFCKNLSIVKANKKIFDTQRWSNMYNLTFITLPFYIKERTRILKKRCGIYLRVPMDEQRDMFL